MLGRKAPSPGGCPSGCLGTCQSVGTPNGGRGPCRNKRNAWAEVQSSKPREGRGVEENRGGSRGRMTSRMAEGFCPPHWPYLEVNLSHARTHTHTHHVKVYFVYSVWVVLRAFNCVLRDGFSLVFL